MKLFLLFLFIVIALWLIGSRLAKRRTPISPNLAPNLKEILAQNIVFYQLLEEAEKGRFEKAVNRFIHRVSIEFIGLEENDEDKILVAASAIIPIFNLGDWEYPNLTNVILYPDTFNHDFDFKQGDRSILGMVGSGYLNGQMILSQKSLREGFASASSSSNTGIHEFIHLLDKSDGTVDGIPNFLLDKPYVLPWVKMMHQEMQKIAHGHSDINPYGATNEGEFLAVVSEYFFTQPDKMRQKHPELYARLEQVFQRSRQE